ncbi:MAG: 6-bladed beta-propeller [Marinifilaceae bacterium]|jgi:hypothetical protein|nr:6-bladed beta-propeller [Marinifilaceae bacterium]
MKNYLFTLFILIIICSCTSKNDDNRSIDVAKAINNPISLDINKYVSNIKYIPLETKSECMIGEIKKVLKSKDYIFVADFSDNLFVFDLNGKFVKKIGNKGKGPNEYISITDFAINNAKQEIIIASLNEFLVFKFNGDFIQKSRLNDSSLQVISVDDSDRIYYIKPIGRPSKILEDLICIYNIKGELLKTIKASIIRQKGDIPFFNSIYTKNNNTYYKEEFSNRLYILNSKLEKNNFLDLNFGKYAFDQVDFSFARAKNWGSKYRLKQFMDFENIDLIIVQKGLLGNNILTLILDKETGKLINPNNLSDRKFEGIIIKGISHKPLSDYNNELLTLIDPEEIVEHRSEISNELAKVFSVLKIDSNPVIGIMYIK